MATALKEDMLEGLMSPSVTCAGFDAIIHTKMVPLMTNRCMTRKVMDHLDGKCRGMPDIVEPGTVLEMGWHHARSLSMDATSARPAGVLKEMTNILVELEEDLPIPLYII